MSDFDNFMISPKIKQLFEKCAEQFIIELCEALNHLNKNNKIYKLSFSIKEINLKKLLEQKLVRLNILSEVSFQTSLLFV